VKGALSSPDGKLNGIAVTSTARAMEAAKASAAADLKPDADTAAKLPQDNCGPRKTVVEFLIDPDSSPSPADVAAAESPPEPENPPAEDDAPDLPDVPSGAGSDTPPGSAPAPKKSGESAGLSADDMHSSKAYVAGAKISSMFKTKDPALGKLCVNDTIDLHETLEESLPPCFKKGYDPFGRKIYFNKCTQTTSMERPPSELGPDVPSSEEVVSGCSNRMDCFACVKQESAITFCGWCEDEYPGKCMESMFGKGKPVDGECKAWSDEICFKSPCPDQMDCPSCVGEPSCGWCFSSNLCHERITQPWGDEPRNGTCEKFKFVKGVCAFELPQCGCKKKHGAKYAKIGGDLPDCGDSNTKGARLRNGTITGNRTRLQSKSNKTKGSNATRSNATK
jgi:hypothetical protein